MSFPLYVAKPVKFEPGTKWTYCQSGINTAARVVEVVSGAAFDEFVDRRLFGPLGMKDTTFYLTETQLPRLCEGISPERSRRARNDGGRHHEREESGTSRRHIARPRTAGYSPLHRITHASARWS